MVGIGVRWLVGLRFTTSFLLDIGIGRSNTDEMSLTRKEGEKSEDGKTRGQVILLYPSFGE